MRRIEVNVYFSNEKGYVFASDTIILGEVIHTVVNPIVFLPIDKACANTIGEYVRKGLEISQNADPVDRDAVGPYEFWKDLGIKSYNKFSKEFDCLEIEEVNDKLFYRKFLREPRGGYIGACRVKDRKSVANSISNQELGELIQREMV